MYLVINSVLVISGSIFLFFSLIPIRNIIKQLEKSTLKLKWNAFGVMVIFFIAGYYFYLYNYWVRYSKEEIVDIFTPLIFFLGGIFVFLVGTLASQTAKDMKKITLLEHTCNTDSLMGINNRRYFDKRLKEELNHSLRYGLPISLLLIDIDHFKAINDSYGHQAGDEALKLFAETMVSVARESDIISRYGGEEIAIITPNTNKENVLILAERLRTVIEASKFSLPCSMGGDISMTISIGISVFDVNSFITAEDFIHEADQALYYAKDTGRNRVVVFDNSKETAVAYETITD